MHGAPKARRYICQAQVLAGSPPSTQKYLFPRRVVRELKEQLAQDVAVDMDAHHPLAIGVLLKVSRTGLYYSHTHPTCCTTVS